MSQSNDVEEVAILIGTLKIIHLKLESILQLFILLWPLCRPLKIDVVCKVSLLYRHKSCIPTAQGVTTKNIAVSLYKASFSGIEPECAMLKIEEHTECKCGCAITAASCNSMQFYEESKCACTCLDQEARAACYRRPGWYWSEETCQCLCRPKEDWDQCATGYQFDPLVTCSCVSMSERAGLVLIIMVILLIISLITTITSLIVCHRKKVGLFKGQRRDKVMEQIRRKSSAMEQNKQTPLITWTRILCCSLRPVLEMPYMICPKSA